MVGDGFIASTTRPRRDRRLEKFRPKAGVRSGAERPLFKTNVLRGGIDDIDDYSPPLFWRVHSTLNWLADHMEHNSKSVLRFA